MYPTIPFLFDLFLDLIYDALFCEKLGKPLLKDETIPWTPTKDIVSRADTIDCRLRADSPHPLAGEFSQVLEYCSRFGRQW